jgi:hypothetical protein
MISEILVFRLAFPYPAYVVPSLFFCRVPLFVLVDVGKGRSGKLNSLDSNTPVVLIRRCVTSSCTSLHFYASVHFHTFRTTIEV